MQLRLVSHNWTNFTIHLFYSHTHIKAILLSKEMYQINYESALKTLNTLYIVTIKYSFHYLSFL